MSLRNVVVVSLLFFAVISFQNCADYSAISNDLDLQTSASNASDDSNTSSNQLPPSPPEPLPQGMPDFHLRPDSPAIGAGVDVEEVQTDFDGKPRVRGRYDIGAFAF